ncbi:MAG: histidine--tRNA ligase [Flavobacteriales bacterium]|nr:histidine--tRNA ligase [Flavobacteriales bacterium]
MAEKPSIPKGTRDFGPQEMVRRNYIFETIRGHFRKYGFLPIETPAMENLKTLMGKYGEEGDRLIFRILNSGDFLDGMDLEELKSKGSLYASSKISEKALRYDLTVPFARFVVQHQNEISFPFKRYQIQPVWRADRPQRGRYREFYQCDADMIGSDSLLNEIELIRLMDDVFTDLNIKTTIKLNNRKILGGIAEITGEQNRIVDITVAIDKLDKIGEEAVLNEMREKGISENAIAKIQPLLTLKGSAQEQLNVLQDLFVSSETGKKGIDELRYIFNLFQSENMQLSTAILELDITLARGLNYYTGAIFEVKSNEGELKVSITGGGRYDDLTGIFGLKGMSGVGISFGADRIYDVLTELNRFPESHSDSTQLLFVNFGEQEAFWCIQLLQLLRKNGINAELYPDKAKMAKQMKYADDKQIPYVALVGSSELESGTITVKNMKTGEQKLMRPEELIQLF